MEWNVSSLFVHQACNKANEPHMAPDVMWIDVRAVNNNTFVMFFECMTKNVLHKINCQKCKKVDIGETKRIVGRRIKEHWSDENSAVKRHVIDKHQWANYISWEILHRNLHNERRDYFIESKYVYSGNTLWWFNIRG